MKEQLAIERVQYEEQQASALTPMGILQLAVSKDADVDKLTKLLELQERWQANQARMAFHAAIAKFKANPPRITKNKHVKFGNTEYDHATLDHVGAQVTKALSEVGVSYNWQVQQDGAQLAVSCVLTHELGHSETTTLKASPDTSGSKNAIQAIGSAVTYLQRYTLLAAVGLAAGGDDDGQSSENARMQDELYCSHMDAIEGAANIQELQSVFAVAFRAAQDAGDKDALAKFTKSKDNRKGQLK